MMTLSLDGLQALVRGVGIETSIPLFPSADIQNSPMGIYLSYLAEILVQLTECSWQVAYESIQWPSEMGDLVVVLPRLRLKDVTPDILAVDLKKRFPASLLFGHPFDDGINLRLFFRPSALARVLIPYILDRGPSYGKNLPAGICEVDAVGVKRKKVVVEFSSPNIGQEFDAAHLRSTIIGAYIACQHESMGWDVVRMNFLGDWGKHIGLLAVGWSRFGSDELFEADPLRHLLEVYTKIDELFKPEQDAAKKLRAEGQDNSGIEGQGIFAEKDAFFKKMEDGDPDALKLWTRFRDVCITNYIDLYARLNITFQEYSGESKVRHDTIAEVESILKEKGLYQESEGAWIIDFRKNGSKGLGTCIARYRNGTTSYLLRDIAAALERSREYSFDKLIYVVSAKQESHFQQLFRALELMDYSDLANRLQHVSFGKVQGLWPKEGNGVLLGDILDQCKTAIQRFLEADEGKIFHGVGPKLLDTLGATALMSQDLSVKRLSNLKFETTKMAVADKATGLTLQHWFAKLSSKLDGRAVNREELERADYSMLEEEEYADVLRLLAQFPDIVKSSFKSLESSIILAYLFHLTDLLSAVWNEEEDDLDQNLSQLAFYEVVRHVIENGMRMVALVPIVPAH